MKTQLFNVFECEFVLKNYRAAALAAGDARHSAGHAADPSIPVEDQFTSFKRVLLEVFKFRWQDHPAVVT